MQLYLSNWNFPKINNFLWVFTINVCDKYIINKPMKMVICIVFLIKEEKKTRNISYQILTDYLYVILSSAKRTFFYGTAEFILSMLCIWIIISLGTSLRFRCHFSYYLLVITHHFHHFYCSKVEYHWCFFNHLFLVCAPII